MDSASIITKIRQTCNIVISGNPAASIPETVKYIAELQTCLDWVFP